ncbi:phosphomannomutase [Noviherbaspirillum autotrophicum]|uniref:phosphomannomutase n=1 Tax=Noviherbaspirillum autotrophicum TaxID=709839 RepID=UPI000AA0A8B0|nr:phosphomannomutase [Noviherbaspirillum autotrophicum]
MSIRRIVDLINESGVRFGTSGVRGLVSDMTDEVCFAYVIAFLESCAGAAECVVLGHDLRPSSPKISAACADAIRKSGREVTYCGALPTPALAYYAFHAGLPAVVVTGSHIPFDRNGIKFYRADGEISKSDEESIANAVINTLPITLQTTLPIVDSSAYETYVQRYLQFFKPNALSDMRIGVYEHSSVARDVIREILEGLGANVIPLGRTNTFVPIDTEAVRSEDVKQAKLWANDHKFDAILSTDGDADRPLIGDENGHWLRGDVVGILCAQFLNAEVVVTPVSSNTAVEKCGQFKKVVRTRIGSPYVIADMETELNNSDAVVVGFEANGGFLVGNDLTRNGHRLSALPTRDAVLPMLALLCTARERGWKLSRLTASLPQRFTFSNRLQSFSIESSLSIIEQLRASSTAAQRLMAPDAGKVTHIDSTDGLRVTFTSGDIVHLRPSGNAPELRCYAESNNQERAQQLCDDCLAHISRIHS